MKKSPVVTADHDFDLPAQKAGSLKAWTPALDAKGRYPLQTRGGKFGPQLTLWGNVAPPSISSVLRTEDGKFVQAVRDWREIVGRDGACIGWGSSYRRMAAVNGTWVPYASTPEGQAAKAAWQAEHPAKPAPAPVAKAAAAPAVNGGLTPAVIAAMRAAGLSADAILNIIMAA